MTMPVETRPFDPAEYLDTPMGRTESEMFDRLKAELTRAFAAPYSTYQPLDAETVIKRG